MTEAYSPKSELNKIAKGGEVGGWSGIHVCSFKLYDFRFHFRGSGN